MVVHIYNPSTCPRLRQGDIEFKASIGYIARSHIKKEQPELGVCGSYL
jgi:hypothetical protein